MNITVKGSASYEVFLRSGTGPTNKMGDIGIEIRLKSATHTRHRSPNDFLERRVCREFEFLSNARSRVRDRHVEDLYNRWSVIA